MQKLPLYLILVMFFISGVGHLLRSMWDVPIVIGNIIYPEWTGSIFFVVNSLLVFWGFMALRSLKPKGS